MAAALSAGQEKLAQDSQHAKELMASGKYAEAVAAYKKLVAAVPGNPGLLFDLGLAEYMAGDDRGAVTHLELVVKAQPKLVPALVTLGSARLSLGEPDKAIAPLEKALGAQPENKDTRGLLAGALLGANRPAEAAKQYEKLTNLTPGDSRAWYGLGKSYEAWAGLLFDRLQKIDPQSPYVSALVADTRVQRRQFRSAFFFYREALKKLPNLRGVHAALASVYKKTGHAEWAAEQESKERTIPAPDCKEQPVECAFFAGHDAQALTVPQLAKPSASNLFWQVKAANELAMQSFFQLGQLPPSVESHRLQAEILRDQNQPLKSVKEWKAALELAPNDPRIQAEIVSSYFLASSYQEALNEALKLLQADPRSAQMNFIAGDSLLRLEDPGKAVPYLQAAVSSDPSLLPAKASLGLAMSRLGQNKEAVPLLEQSLELDDDGSLHYQLARAYQAAGQPDKARPVMEQYQLIVKRNQEGKEAAARESQITAPEQ